MSPSSSEEQLLFGVLAVQLVFYPIISDATVDLEELLQRTQRDAGLRLEGFDLVRPAAP